MDPFTLLAGATALYNGIKSATDQGHEMLDVAERVGSLFARVAQITQITSAKKPRRLFQSEADFQAEAIKSYTLKQKAFDLQRQTKNLFISHYGAASWEAIQKEVTALRKEAQREAAAAIKEAEERRQDLIMGAWMLLGVVVAGVGLAATIFFYTHK